MHCSLFVISIFYTITQGLPWDKQRAKFEGVRSTTRKLVRIAYVGSLRKQNMLEEIFMCADPTDRCDERQQEAYTSCMRSFFLYMKIGSNDLVF